MSTPSELELIDKLLDSSRKLHKYIAELPAEEANLAVGIKKQFNKLLNQALDVYFHSEEKAQALAEVILEVEALLDKDAKAQVIYDRLFT